MDVVVPFRSLRERLERLALLCLRPQLAACARELASGKICLFPSQTIYTLVLNGQDPGAVARVRSAKGRRPDQKEGLICPPERLFDFVDFDALAAINEAVSRETLRHLYAANPVGLVLPCKAGVVPNYLVTTHRVSGQPVPTVMNIWNSRYVLYAAFWQELAHYPEVLWVGTSANATGERPLSFSEARRRFNSTVSRSVRDPFLQWRRHRGSYTILSLVTNPPSVLRSGSVHPDLHPADFRRFSRVLPDLAVP